MKEKLRKKVLMWLFETEDVKKYMDILIAYKDELKKHGDTIERNLHELQEHMNTLKLLKKVIKVCKNHSIDIDKEVSELNDSEEVD